MSKKICKAPLKKCFEVNDDTIEIGIDEAGRGPMLGRVYSAAVVLPKDDTFNHSLMKDSKRFHSEKKIREAADYIKKNAIKWSIGYVSEEMIDKINIRNATHMAMHNAIREIIDNFESHECNYHLLVDGNDFKPFNLWSEENGIKHINYTCIEGGDNTYTSIAAASILAKVARDDYIEELCKKYPYLNTQYDILKNKGYGTKSHHDGIIEHGITKFHRNTFGICRNYNKID